MRCWTCSRKPPRPSLVTKPLPTPPCPPPGSLQARHAQYSATGCKHHLPLDAGSDPRRKMKHFSQQQWSNRNLAGLGAICCFPEGSMCCRPLLPPGGNSKKQNGFASETHPPVPRAARQLASPSEGIGVTLLALLHSARRENRVESPAELQAEPAPAPGQ